MPIEKKLRIIHTEASPHWGGQEIRIFEEMKWFREQGHELILVAPDNGTLYQRCKDAGFEVISIYFTKPKLLLNIFKMLFIIWSIKPNMIGTHSSTDSWVALIASYILRTQIRIRYRHVTTKIKNNILNRLQYTKLCNTVFTTANCININLKKMFCINRVFCVPTPIAIPEKMPEKELCRNIIRKKLNLPRSSILIGQVSVIRSWKGHEILIQAFEQVVKSRPNIHVLFIGDGPHFNDVKCLINDKKLESNIHMMGYREDIWTIIRSLEIMLLASTKNEAIPQSLLQAMYAEIPIIASDVGGIPEIIKNKNTGLLVKNNSINEYTLCVSKLLDNQEYSSRLAKNAKIFVSNDFLWEKTGMKMIKAINNG